MKAASESARPLAWLLRSPWLWLFLAVATALRCYQLSTAAIWGDEGSSLLLSQYPLPGIWAHAAHDVHPPLYFMLLHLWIGLFGDSVLSLRLLSALPGVATVFLGAWLTATIGSRRAALLACLLLALLPTAVRYSQEVRMYSWLGLWLIGATLALVYWVKSPERSRYLVMYAGLMLAGFYTHYFTVLCALVHWLYLALIYFLPEQTGRRITRRGWWLANLAILLLYLPWLPGLFDLIQHMPELEVGGDVGWEPPVSLISLPSMIWQLLTQDDQQGLPLWLFALLPSLLLAALVWVAWSDRSHYRFGLLLVLYSALPISLVFAVSFISPVFIERYLSAFALGFAVVLALALDRLALRAKGWAVLLLMVLLAVEIVGLKANFSGDPDDQFDTMANYVNQHYQTDDQIVMGDMLWYLPYVYYDRTGARVRLFTAPAANGSSRRPNGYGFGTLIDEQAGVYLDRLDQLPASTRRVWLVMSREDPDEFPLIPTRWRKIDQKAGGDTQAVLYEIGLPPAGG